MRKIFWILALCALLCLPSRAVDEQALREALPHDAQALLDDAPCGSFSGGLQAMLERIVPDLDGMLREALGPVALMLATLVLCAVAHGESTPDAAIVAGAISILSAGMLEVHALARAGEGALEELQSFSSLLLPAMAVSTAATGGLTASTALYAGTAFFCDVLMRVMRALLLPVVYAYVALHAAQAVCGGDLLSRLAALLRWAFQTGLKAILFVFTGYLTVTGLVSGSADAVAVKAAKLTLSGVVPVVGSMLSDASETVLVGAAAVRNGIGIFGMLAVLAICVGPFLRIGVRYVLLKLASAAGSALGVKPLLALMDAVGEALGFLLAMTGTSALLLLISCVCYLKVVPI